MRQLAEETGIAESTLSKIERGLVNPTNRQRHTLAGYFGRSIGDLLAPAESFHMFEMREPGGPE